MLRYLVLKSLILCLATHLCLVSNTYAQDRDPVRIDQVSETQSASGEGNPVPTIEDMDRGDAEDNIFELFDSDSDSYARLRSFLDRDRNASGSFGAVMQDGDTNTANLTQEGRGNVGVIDQLGNNNIAKLFQQGNQNRTYALQNGDENEINVSLIGDDNVFGIEQYGNGNSYVLNFGRRLGVTHSNTAWCSDGNDLSLSQDGFSTTGPASVVQSGNGMEVNIEHNQ